MHKHLKTAVSYLLILASGLAIGYLAPRALQLFQSDLVAGNYQAYYPNPQTKVVLYGTEWCGYCAQTRAYLKEKNIAFLDLDIEKSPEAAAQHKALGGGGVPRLLIGDNKIVGFKPQAIDQALQILKQGQNGKN